MAFDVDGTLLVDGNIAPEATEATEAIHRWQAAGNLAICSTGKSLYAANKTFEGSGITFDYSVLFTGAVVSDSKDRVLFQKKLEPTIVAEVVEHLLRYDTISIFATDIDGDCELYNPLKQSSHMLLNFQPLDLAELKNHDIIGIPLQVKDENLRAEIYRWLTSNYSEHLDCHLNQDFIDIVPPQCTKATGLAWLTEHVLAHQELETYSIGDSWNDLPMHQWAQHSASFTYSPQEVQKATESIVSTAQEYIDANL